MTEELRILVKAEARRAIQELKALESQSGKTEGSGKKLTETFGQLATGIGAVAAATTASIAVLGDMVSVFRENERAAARLDAVLRATGGAAGISSVELANWREELFQSTLLTTQQIDSMSGLLLTFRQIGEDVFPRAQRAVADMSELFGGLDSSAIQLGKALNDPVQGISALQRIGITFSDRQREMITNFMEMNDVASAQGVILDEIENQVGGTAEAMANLATSGFDRLGRSWDDLKSIIGESVTFLFDPIIRGADNALSSVNNFFNGIRAYGRSGEIIGSFQEAVVPLWNALQGGLTGGAAASIDAQLLAALSEINVDEVIAAYDMQIIEIEREIERLQERADTAPTRGIREAIDEELQQKRAIRRSLLRQQDIAETEQQRRENQRLLDTNNNLNGALEDESETLKDIAKTVLPMTQDVEQLGEAWFDVAKNFIAYSEKSGADMRQISGEIKNQVGDIETFALKTIAMFEELENQFGGVFDAAQGLYSAWGDLEKNRHENAMANMKRELSERMAYYDEQVRIAERAGQDTTAIEQARINEQARIQEQIAQREEQYRRRAFEQRKLEAIAQATIQGALAVLTQLGLGNIPGAIAIGALAGGQIALIGSQQYPALAEGGVTTGPTMAMIGEGGEPEMVLPLSKAKSMGFGGGVTIVINGDVIGVPRDEFYRNLEQRISSLQRIGVA